MTGHLHTHQTVITNCALLVRAEYYMHSIPTNATPYKKVDKHLVPKLDSESEGTCGKPKEIREP